MAEQERYRATATKKGKEENIKEAKGFIASFIEYVRSGRYRDTLNRISKKLCVPPNKLAHNFFEKVLGVISDVSHVVINVGSSIVDAMLSALCMVMRSAVTVITSVANSLATLITAGYTNSKCTENI